MRTVRCLLRIAWLLLVPSLLLGDENRQSDFRRHFEVIGPAGDVLYEVTEIIRLADDTHSSFMLVRDTGHGDFVMRNVWTFENQVAITRISDLKDRAFVQMAATMPFQSKTRLETMAEAKGNPWYAEVPLVVKMETNGGRWDSLETDIKESQMLRRIRHDLRRTVDFFLPEAIERMRDSLFGIAEGEPYLAMLARYVIYDVGSEDASQVGIKTGDAIPNCGFDQSFGFPCTEKQKERVAKAAKSGIPVPRY
jgi:hypothetical protein